MPTKLVHKDLEVLSFATVKKWLAWLERNHGRDAGIWIKLAKKQSGISSINYEQVREGALSYGWIDGQINRWDDDWYLIRCTPRRPRSKWSKINREIATELIKKKKIRPSGLAEVNAAKQDGRWDAAYDSSSTIEVPSELKKLLDGHATARKNFEKLNSANRYAFLYRIQVAKRTETRQKHIERTFEMLKRDEVIHPGQSKKKAESVAKKSAKKVPAKSKHKTSGKPVTMVALLRGINVGGKNKLKMAELREQLELGGLENVRTYIQSGNILFDSKLEPTKLEKKIRTLIKKQFALEVPTLVRSAQFFKTMERNCPYDEVAREFLHTTILDTPPTKANISKLKSLDLGDDSFVVRKDVVYLHCPNGYARTKLNNQFLEQKLDRSATTRNWKTIGRLIELSG